MKLSIKAIDAIKPTDKRAEFPDHIVQGLRLIVQPSGIKSFQLRYRHAGKGKRMSLGRLDRGATLASVRNQARAALLQLETGADPQHEATQAKAVAISINKTAAESFTTSPAWTEALSRKNTDSVELALSEPN